MAKINLPGTLVRAANIQTRELEASGATVQEIIENCCDKHAELRGHLFYPNGEFKNHFLLTMNDEHCRIDETANDDVKIDILMATSGGLDEELELTNEDIKRYVRHITLPGVGRAGQKKLKNSKVLLVGTGGLGSPIAMYLSAAGVGTIGIIDFDVVEVSNLQRQIIHGNGSLGLPKVESARNRILDINSDINVKIYPVAITEENALSIISEYDVVVDGTDNFSTRYLINDACVMLKKPLVYGAIYSFEGQTSVFNLNGGPCYRCLFPKSPPPELSPNCTEGGVIGVLPGVIGLLQATETIKIIIGIGDSLAGKFMTFNALDMTFNKFSIKKNKSCPVCSDNPVITSLSREDYICKTSEDTGVKLDNDRYIEPHELKEKLQDGNKNFVLIDVRDPGELEVCALEEAVNIPLDSLVNRIEKYNTDKLYYIFCYANVRAEQAVATMLNHGFKKVYAVKGGMKRWASEIDREMPIY